MAKLLGILFYLANLYDHGLSDDSMVRRKSDLFLTQNAISGGGGISPPEDYLPETNVFPLFQSHVDPRLRAIVLGGNYPRGGLDIPDANAVKEAEEELNVQGHSHLDFLMDPIGRFLTDPLKQNSDNGTVEVMADGEVAYSKQLLECQKKLVLCSLGKVFNVRCYLHCMLSAHPIGSMVSESVDGLIKFLCEPLGTIFDWGVPLYNRNFEMITHLSHYLTILQVGPTIYTQFARGAINSLPTILMKYTGLDEAIQMKPTINGLETAVKNANQGFRDVAELSNHACPYIDSIDSVQQLVEIFYRNPKIVDIVLSGFWTVSKIFGLLPRTQRVPLVAFGAGLNILSGAECGLIYSAETGVNSTCENDDTVEWVSGRSVPAENARPVVCGAVPSYIPDILDDLYPPVYLREKDEEKTTEKPMDEEGEGGEGDLAGRSNTVGLDLSWMDELLKSFDTDDGYVNK